MSLSPNYTFYTDGGGYNHGKYKGLGAAAWVCVFKGTRIVSSNSASFLESTTNQMELMAVAMVLDFVEKNLEHFISEKCVWIHSDSKYVGKMFHKLEHESEETLKLSGYENIPYLIKLLHQKQSLTQKGLTVCINWVKGHNGDVYNEYVDSLCTEAMSSRKKEEGWL